MTTDDIHFDIQYGYSFNLACEQVYRRLDFLLNIVQLVGGSGAALAVISSSQAVLVWTGIALSLAAAVALLVQPALKAAGHAQAKAGFIKLLGKSADMTTQQAADAIAELRVSAPAGFGALANPAYNAAAQAMGRVDAVVSVNRFERLMQAIA